MFLASNYTCAVYFTYTAHVQLLAKNMAATLRFCREDNPLYVFTLCFSWLATTGQTKAFCVLLTMAVFQLTGSDIPQISLVDVLSITSICFDLSNSKDIF